MPIPLVVPALITAATTAWSAYNSNKNQKEALKSAKPQGPSQFEKAKGKLIDKLLKSISTGEGPFADLYKADENTFQKSFVDPATSLFQNKIAPQIQAEFSANGQQRGTGINDTLTRAGVDLDALLNQHLASFQQGAQNRSQSVINNVLGQGGNNSQPGTQGTISNGSAALEGVNGFLGSKGFADTLAQFTKQAPTQQNQPSNIFQEPPRKGFEGTNQNWDLGQFSWNKGR